MGALHFAAQGLPDRRQSDPLLQHELAPHAPPCSTAPPQDTRKAQPQSGPSGCRWWPLRAPLGRVCPTRRVACGPQLPQGGLPMVARGIRRGVSCGWVCVHLGRGSSGSLSLSLSLSLWGVGCGGGGGAAVRPYGWPGVRSASYSPGHARSELGFGRSLRVSFGPCLLNGCKGHFVQNHFWRATALRLCFGVRYWNLIFVSTDTCSA